MSFAEGELREIKEGVYVSLSQSQPEGLENDFCLNAGGRMYFFFRKAAAFTRLAASGCVLSSAMSRSSSALESIAISCE